MNTIVLLATFLLLPCFYKCEIDVNTLFVTKVLVTYNEALQTCKSRGMQLVRVDTAEDNAIVNGFANRVLVDWYWIDGNDQSQEGRWVDSRERELIFKNFAANEPNGGRVENCISVLRLPNGLWYDAGCAVRLWAICQKDYNNPFNIAYNQLEIEGNEFIMSPRKLTFSESQEFCNKNGLRMITISNAFDNAVVHSFARETNAEFYWVNANDIENEGKWVDNEGNPIIYANFHPGEPGGKRVENCANGYLNIDGYWNDFPCHFKLWAICYRPELNKALINPNGLLSSLERLTFNEAAIYCREQGLKMTKINSAAENALIHGFARRYYLDLYWLDGNDEKTEGQWVDANGNDLTFKEFHPGEPNGGKNENCMNGYLLLDGLWNDFPCNYKNVYAICSVDNLRLPYPVEYGISSDNMFVSTDRYTYNEAIQFCRTRRGNLARVHNEKDNVQLASFAKSVVADLYWIDANDYTEEGKWIDSDGNVLTYKNWAANEPNGARAENCVFSYYLEEGTWRDIVCWYKYLAICTFYPIA